MWFIPQANSRAILRNSAGSRMAVHYLEAIGTLVAAVGIIVTIIAFR
jgi:hypothetical protein